MPQVKYELNLIGMQAAASLVGLWQWFRLHYWLFARFWCISNVLRDDWFVIQLPANTCCVHQRNQIYMGVKLLN